MKVILGNVYVFVLVFIFDDEVKCGDLVFILIDMELFDYSVVYVVYLYRDLLVRICLFFDVMCEYIGKDILIWEVNIFDFDIMYKG